MESVTSFESALAAVQASAVGALKSATAVTRELRKARAAAASGQVRELRRALDTSAQLVGELGDVVREARAAYDFNEAAYLASGGYVKELLAAAAERGLSMYEEDERLLCYPSIVRVLPGDTAVEVDRRRERRIRPSVLIGLLAARQQRPPKFRYDQFLESLVRGYDLVVALAVKKPGTIVRLVDIWAVLTLLPGQAKEYTRPEFARDLYLLDRNGALQAKDGRVLRFHASSGTRTAGVLNTVAQSGQRQTYWGVSFAARDPQEPR